MDIYARIVFGVLLPEDKQPINITEELERELNKCGARFEYDGDATAGSVCVVLAAGPYFAASHPGASPTAFELPPIEEAWRRSLCTAANGLGLRTLVPGWLLLVGA